MPLEQELLALFRLPELEKLHLILKTHETPPITWLMAKSFTLLELRHPRQLLRAGKEARNCLGREELPLARYWEAVARDEMRVFEIRHRLKLCALFTVASRAYHEWQFLKFPAGLQTFVDACVDKLNTEYGPLADCINEIALGRDHVVYPCFEEAQPGTEHLISPQLILRSHR
ncbi:hypothetical protein HYPGJ_31462 [Hyphomicrobium sp. GJ21]|uniref:hypothetical protein n=1 Tax=Hyphomicrobium sp. GJ21 TaxID=113574 RepID=UPI000622B78F|nr:hypothetical protein [Hyphomicrobium sp. GJ21]CEJ87914.1 hypothetical protein HYPGJ_31462 [Hyphomicrobium sp. GJ21]